jgi:hypothetical protein
MSASSIFSNINNGIGTVQNLLNIFGGFQQMQQQRRLYNDRVGAGDVAREGTQFQRDLLLSVFPELRDSLMNSTDMGNLLSIGSAENPGALLQAYQQLQTNPQMIQQLFSGLGITPGQGQFLDPQMSWAGQAQANSENLGGRNNQAFGQLDSLSQFFSNMMNGGISTSQNNAGEELLQNGGQTALGNQAAGLFGQLANNGGKSADLTSLMQVLMGGDGTGGKTNELTSALQSALGMINGGNQDSANAIGAAQNILNSGGVTQNSNQGSQAALRLLQNGGMTPELQQASNVGLDKASREALLTDQQAQNFLSGVLGTQAVRNTSEANRLATMRGGGAGALVDSGAQENLRKNASTGNLETASNAILNQMMKQQELRLNENQVGNSLFSNAQGAAQNRLGTGASLLGNMEGANTQRFAAGSSLLDSMLGRNNQQVATGFQGLGTAQGLENDRLQTFLNSALSGNAQASGNLGQGAAGLSGQSAQNVANMGAGANLQNSYYQLLMNAANGMSGTAGQNLQAGQQGLGWGGLSTGTLQNGLQGYNQSMAGNESQLTNFLTQLRGNTTDLTNLGNTFLGLGQNGQQGFGSLVSSLLGGYNNGMSNFAGLFGNSGNSWQNPFQQAQAPRNP